jgi:hypothetical protein
MNYIELAGIVFLFGCATAFAQSCASINGGGNIFSTKYFITPTTPPAIAAGCGTGASVVAGSGDNGGQIIFGTGTFTSCTISFAVAYASRSFCVVVPTSALTATYGVSSSAAQMEITTSISAPGTEWTYHCDGQ